MRFFYCLLFSYLTACSAYGPWNTQNQGSQIPPYYGPNGLPYDPNNPPPNYDPNNPPPNYDPNNPPPNYDPNNPPPNYDPNNPPLNYDPNNSRSYDINTPPRGPVEFLPDPFPEGPGASRSNDLPYELIPDTITAVTCEQTVDFNAKKPYTVSVGSYREPYGGLRLSEDFVRNNKIDGRMPYQKVRQLLEASPLKRVMAQLSIRDENDIRRLFHGINRQPFRDYFQTFYQADNLDRLSRQGISFTTRSSSNRDAQNSGRFKAILSSLSGSGFIELASSLEENTLGTALLTLVYSMGNDSPMYSSEQRAYGRSYKLSFRDSIKADYLTGIYEENLRTSKREGNWECPIRFMVHRATREDSSDFNKRKGKVKHPPDLLKEGFCYTGGRSSFSSLERRFFEEEFGNYKTAFSVGTTLVFDKEGDDEIVYDTQYPCLVPKGTNNDCYNPGFHRIEFDPQKECSDRAYRLGSKHRNNPMEMDYYKVCPAFLSVCFRTRD